MKAGISKSGVGKTMAEGKERVDTSCIKMLVPYPDTFVVINPGACRFVVQVGGNIKLSFGECHREATRRVGIPVDNVGDGITSLVSQVPSKHHTFHFVEPRH